MAPYHLLRVFCDEEGHGGNPLAVFLDGATVAQHERQAVATELGYSETVFVDDTERGRLRIFTPVSEMPFAGHPTVGTAWLLREQGAARRAGTAAGAPRPGPCRCPRASSRSATTAQLRS